MFEAGLSRERGEEVCRPLAVASRSYLSLFLLSPGHPLKNFQKYLSKHPQAQRRRGKTGGEGEKRRLDRDRAS
eukprot:scaffold9942_cov22-Tisochrysis_lutea.AAC.1